MMNKERFIAEHIHYNRLNEKMTIEEIERRIHILMNYECDFGDLCSVDEFIEDVNSGYFTDYDVEGVFVDNEGNEVDGFPGCDADEIIENAKEFEVNYIMWFNK